MTSISLGSDLQQHSSAQSMQEGELSDQSSRHVHFAPDQLSGSHRRPEEFRKVSPINRAPVETLNVTEVPFENWVAFRHQEEGSDCLLHWEALVCLAKTVYAVFTSTISFIGSAIFCCEIHEQKQISCGLQWSALWGNIKALFCPKRAIEECWNSRIALDRKI